jgi:hypothetical protein
MGSCFFIEKEPEVINLGLKIKKGDEDAYSFENIQLAFNASKFKPSTVYNQNKNIVLQHTEIMIDSLTISPTRMKLDVSFNIEKGLIKTYTIIIEAPNPDQKLMPGMTATANIYINEVKDVLTVNNRAFRFNPDQKTLQVMLKGKTIPKDSLAKITKRRRPSMAGTTPPPESQANRISTVWVKKGDNFVKTTVNTGLSDGINTEVKSGLNEGDQVVVAAVEPGKNNAPPTQERSPFMPRRPNQRTAPRR